MKKFFIKVSKDVGWGNIIGCLFFLLLNGAWVYWMIWFIPHSQFGEAGYPFHWIWEIIVPAIVGLIIAAIWAIALEELSQNGDSWAVFVSVIMFVIFVVGVILWGVNYNSTLVQKETTIQLLDLDLENPLNVINKFDEYTGVRFGGAGAGGIANVQIDESLSQFTREKLERVFIVISTDLNPNSEMSPSSERSLKRLVVHYYGMESEEATRIFHAQGVIYTAPNNWTIVDYSFREPNKLFIIIKNNHHGDIRQEVLDAVE